MSEEKTQALQSRAQRRRHRARHRRREFAKYLRLAVGGAFLAGLATAALVASHHPLRLVHVLPHEGRTEYEINVFSGGEPLDSDEVAARYRIPFHGSTMLTPHGLRTIVRHREGRSASANDTFVRMHLRPDGGKEEIWLWPEN
ncbi:MAG: hypothetical protein ACREIA_09595 [Opitutaceae bacterium]